MNKVLSVIIPSYNMEDYLQKCLDSLILDDERQMEILEVLVVNDGSTDSTSAIAHKYQKRYPDIFRVVDKENGHYGSCVNKGLIEANGKYVKILDADDWFDTDALRTLLKMLSTSDADMVITNYNIVNNCGKVKKEKIFDLPKDKQLRLDVFCPSDSFAKLQMHAVIYRLNKLTENSYTQTEGVPYTDQEWIFLPVTFMETFIYCPIFLYQYLIGREGQSMDPHIKIGNNWTSFNLLLKRATAFQQLKDSTSISKNKLTYLENKLKSSVLRLYRSCLIYHQVDLKTLSRYDNQLKMVDKELYDYVSMDGDKALFGLRYVNDWRRTGHINIIVTIISFILRKIR